MFWQHKKNLMSLNQMKSIKSALNWKIAVAIFSGLISLLLFISPLIVAAGVVAVPIVAINQLFQSIGDFVFGDNDLNNQVIQIIEKYLNQKETKEMIKKLYQPLINKQKDEIPLHWLLIPNLLAGIEDVTADHINKQISLIIASDSDLETYINKLRKTDPWKNGFKEVTTTTIVGYINMFTNYLDQEGSIDIGDLKEEELLYPLKAKAIITSEFGQRWPVTLPNGQVVDQPHEGIDLAYGGGDAKTCGVPIYASMSGEVVANERTQGQAGANWGSVRFKNLDIWYLHLRYPFPYEVGTKIKKGQFVGYVGSSGLSTACHLHFETHVNGKSVNPRNFLEF